jgi:DNA-binding IclR family transcriptional regulator
MALKIAGVLEMLSDGEWHTLQRIRRKMKLNKDQIQQIALFLEEYEFVAVDETKNKIKIEEAVRKFLAKEATS